jgi:hypothetical protein
MDKREELTTDELEDVSGGLPSIGIGMGFGTDGSAVIKWPAADGGYWSMTSGTNGVLWTKS